MKFWIHAAFALLAAIAIGGCTAPGAPAPTATPTWTVSSGPAETLPSSMHERTIDSLEVGESGYTMSWAMWVDLNSNMWLNPKYPVGAEVVGTSNMRVERRGDGFHVWPPSDAKYTPEEEPGYVGGANLEWIRVVAIEGVR